MMKILVLCMVVVVAYSTDQSLDDHWSNFKKAFAKKYLAEKEELARRLIWERNVALIAKHNLEADLGEYSYTLGQNMYADLTNEEFLATMNGLKMPSRNSTVNLKKSPDETTLPKEVDWRKEGYVTEVKNQGPCGSCWAFSATGALEGQHKKKTGKLVSLSEQNLIDCAGPQGNKGCDGGIMVNAFEYVEQNGGIDTESCYPYTGVEGTCRFDPNCIGATCIGYAELAFGDEHTLKEAVANVGPVSVAIDASSTKFQLYANGVYDDLVCSQTQLDHGVLVVGYGTDAASRKEFWIVKNSWGPSWGMKGYILMSRNKNNQCGIASMASYPDV